MLHGEANILLNTSNPQFYQTALIECHTG